MSPRSPRRFSTRILVVLLAALMPLSACSSRDTQADPGASGGGAARGGFSVVDQRGETVSFDAPIDSAAFAVIPAPAIFTAVDRSYDKVAGINDSTRTANRQGIFSTMFPDSADTPIVSGSDFVPNVETVASLAPDVMIQWADRGDEIIQPLEDSGIKVVGLKYGTQEDLETWITLFSQLLGKEERGRELVDWQHAEIDRMHDIVDKQQRSGAKKPRAMMLSASDGSFTANSAKGYDGFQYELVGADLVSRDLPATNSQVNVEQIIEWDPEVILLSGFDQSVPDDIYTDPRFAEVSAVKERRVYKNPLGGYRWQVPSVESPLYWRWLHQVLYPDSEQDVRQEAAKAFDRLFGYQISDSELDQVLRNDVNAGSANYDVFR